MNRTSSVPKFVCRYLSDNVKYNIKVKMISLLLGMFKFI